MCVHSLYKWHYNGGNAKLKNFLPLMNWSLIWPRISVQCQLRAVSAVVKDVVCLFRSGAVHTCRVSSVSSLSVLKKYRFLALQWSIHTCSWQRRQCGTRIRMVKLKFVGNDILAFALTVCRNRLNGTFFMTLVGSRVEALEPRASGVLNPSRVIKT